MIVSNMQSSKYTQYFKCDHEGVFFFLLLKRVLNFRILQEHECLIESGVSFLPIDCYYGLRVLLKESFTSNLNYLPLYNACLFNLHLPSSS